MATEIEVDLNVSSNIGGSIKQLKELKKQLKDTEVGTEAFKNLFNQIDDLEDKIKSAKNTSSDWVDSLEMAGGPLGALGGAINKAKVATQSFSGALKATGIGLIVGLVSGLVAAFNDNEKAVKKLQPLFTGLEKIFNGVFAAIEPLFNILVDLAISALPMVSKAMQVVYSSVTTVIKSLGSLGSAVAKFIKGDFSGAWKDAKASVTDFGKNYDKSVKNFEDGAKQLTKTEKEELDKRKKNREAAALELQKEREAEKKRIDDAFNETLQVQGDNQMKAFEKDAELENERIQQEGQRLFDLYDVRQRTMATYEANITADAKEQADERKRIAQIEAETKANIQQAYVNYAMQLGQGLRQIAGENKELAIAGIILEQGAAIASIAMNASKNFVKDGGVTSPLAWVGLAGSVAAGLSAVSAGAKGIQDIRSGNASGSNMSFGNPQMTPSYSTAPQFNVVGTSGVNQIAQVVGQGQQPVKAYVVSSEVSSQQSLDRNKVMSASLG
ncbi:hypothetical protein UFOVP520_41 [uncultured Caudovirales phage]|jgi:tetrahydromethanopterin S-methyltransferase subunit B|uniref:Uncharacterized protein n=1 Tax=uncultured Caudovirales phage TaxID=2100421 RepID=A0A6J5MNS9_9CAUD|nr:hypothetical protein UFOVP520_41 [uncultured Caudovirales phage]